MPANDIHLQEQHGLSPDGTPEAPNAAFTGHNVHNLGEAIIEQPVDTSLARRAEQFITQHRSTNKIPPQEKSTRGRVTDPANDHRLKQNREKSDEDSQEEDLSEHVKNKEKEMAQEEHRYERLQDQRPSFVAAKLLQDVKYHEVYGAEIQRRLGKTADLQAARQYLKNELVQASDVTIKNTLQTLISKVATLLIEAGGLGDISGGGCVNCGRTMARSEAMNNGGSCYGCTDDRAGIGDGEDDS